MSFRAGIVCLLGALVVAIAACGDEGTEAPSPGAITGEVLVEGTPLAGVTVELSGVSSATTTTNDSGDYTFEGLEPGVYEVRITGLPAGVELADQDATVTVEAGGTATASFDADYVRTARIEGTVTADGDPVPDATVRLSGVESRETTTNAQGAFAFSELRAGEYSVEVSNVGENVELDQNQRTVNIAVGDAVTLAFEGELVIPAQVEVPYIERPNTSLRLNLTEIQGEVDVIALVDPGTETVSRVRAYMRGQQVGSVSFPTGLTSEQKVEIRVNTGAFDPESGDPTFENGEAIVVVDVATAERGDESASGSLTITLANRDRIAGVGAADVGDGVVTGGRRWHGNRDLTFEVVPVLYDESRTIGAISLQASGDPSGNGGPALDFGSGPGQPHRVEGPPFLFTATVADNAGMVEDRPGGAGHTLRVEAVFDGEGEDVTADFIPGRTEPLENFYVDFVPPQVGSSPGVSVNGTPIAGGEWFSAGPFGVTPLSEGGSGQVTVDFEVDATDQTDPITGVETIGDLAEKVNSAYSARVVSIRDAVGNETPAGQLPPSSPSFGVDRTSLQVTDILPPQHLALNPNDASSDGITDNRLGFTANDPPLPNGVQASGFSSATATAFTPGTGSIDISAQIAPNGGGVNSIDLSGLGETTWDIEVVASDGATPANESTFNYTVTLDKTSPSVSMIDPPPGTVTADGTVTFTIKGTAADANGLFSVEVIVRDADDNTANVCETADATVASGTNPGQVSPAVRDVTSSADNFSVNITAYEAVGPESDLCFFVEAKDDAQDRHGNPEPNSSSTATRTVITWN